MLDLQNHDAGGAAHSAALSAAQALVEAWPTLTEHEREQVRAVLDRIG